MDSSQLEALLDVLRDAGVEEFEGLDIHVRFRKDAGDPAPVTQDGVRDFQEVPANPWQNPKLWPGGKPPSFPK